MWPTALEKSQESYEGPGEKVAVIPSGSPLKLQLLRRARHNSNTFKMSSYSSSILISETPPQRFTPNERDSSISGISSLEIQLDGLTRESRSDPSSPTPV